MPAVICKIPEFNSVEITNKMQPCNSIIPPFIEGSTCFERHTAHHRELWLYLQPLVYIRSEALAVFAAPGLHTHVVTGCSQVWVGTPLRLDYGQSPHAYVNHRLQIEPELPMMSGTPLETCWAFNERWNNKFYYKVASCWLFLLSHTTMHEFMNIKPEFKWWLHKSRYSYMTFGV
jgi:hypothetical protein